tara:strand:- start:3604 stop:4464 length:861 start_codon:yes stop_codon:yes gene_type:complete
MKNFKYLLQFIIVVIFFIFFKIIGAKRSSDLSGKIFEIIGPFFRSKNIIHSNIKRAYPYIEKKNIKKLTKRMWNNYGRVFAEYMYIKDFRIGKLKLNIELIGDEVLEEIKQQNKQVVFVSGHFSNFELMALSLEKKGIKLSAIYRPLNNIFLNKIIENIREKYICKNQIKKGLGGMKKLIKLKKNNFSTALMIDQRVSEGILSSFFNSQALTTTVPAQLVKKFNIPIVPVYIQRKEGIKFKIIVEKPLKFSEADKIEDITIKLNQVLEKMILRKPEQWIWSHNRWK